MNVSPSFSPSIKLMKPYFLLSGFFYVVSMIWLYFIDPFAKNDSFEIVGWVHLYMLGFVMLSIFAAMAQLGPIVVETKHYAVGIFKFVWIFLVGGVINLLVGFYFNPLFLVVGGGFILISMFIYAIEFMLTLKYARRKTAITNAMKMSNIFLLLGLVNGIIMAFSFNGYFQIVIRDILHAHTFGLIVGFVILLIMGISIVLIPMFGSAKRISDNQFSASFITLSVAVSIMLLSPSFYTTYMQQLSYALTSVAILLYFYQLFKMLSSRAKVTHDIWARHMYVGFTSFVISFLLFIVYYFNHNEIVLNLAMWILLVGFFGFLIIGNFYKVVPFLVWFQVYSPLIEEQAVPMLHELLPKKETDIEFIVSTFGILLSSVGIFISNIIVFYIGVGLLVIGGVLFFLSIYRVLQHG